MPTREILDTFWKDWSKLTPAQRSLFLDAVRQFVDDLKRGQGFRGGLRVKGVQGHRGVYEMTWAPVGRATFAYGTSPQAGDVHIIWRRIGDHSIFKNP
ncbi:MAG: hypothetical protein OJF49_002141 [Ktedonobacterales bacterium]|jgi:hypothetical protein|nr:MAG: hypothetical protein OJF49_002141 [Ktedonobacterales bacterium]